MFDRRENYQRPQGHEESALNIFVHPEICDEFGPVTVDYVNQARLHQYELPEWFSQEHVPGWPFDKPKPNSPDPEDKPPAIYIDMAPLENGSKRKSRSASKKISEDSYLRGDDIHVRLHAFAAGGERALTEASTARLNREILLQSAARAVVRNNRLVYRPDLVHEFWLPGGVGAVTGAAIDVLGANLHTAFGWGAVAAGLIAPFNLAELKDVRTDRIRAIAAPIASTLLKRHQHDFSFGA